MLNHNIIFLQKTVVRKALEQNHLSFEQYENIIKELNSMEEKIRYEKKLQEYTINETKGKLYKEYTSV